VQSAVGGKFDGTSWGMDGSCWMFCKIHDETQQKVTLEPLEFQISFGIDDGTVG
jgi:hypothetical protein